MGRNDNISKEGLKNSPVRGDKNSARKELRMGPETPSLWRNQFRLDLIGFFHVYRRTE